MKRFASILLVCIMLITLISCAPATSETSSPPESGTPESKAPTPEPEKKTDYPTRPITWIVPFSPGGSSDLQSRKIAEIAEDYLGQPIVITNREGGGALIGTTEFVNAKNNGYEILVTPNVLFTTQPFMRDVSFTIDDFRVITGISKEPQVLCVQPDAPYNTFDEMVAYYKDSGESLKFGHSGTGGANYLNQKRLYEYCELSAEHVPFDSGVVALTNLMGGHIDATTGALIETYNYIREGQIKVIGIFSNERDESDMFGDVPTFKEMGYDVEPLMIYKFLCVPDDTPEEIVSALKDAFGKILEDERWIDFCDKNYVSRDNVDGDEIVARILPEIESTHQILIDAGVAIK